MEYLAAEGVTIPTPLVLAKYEKFIYFKMIGFSY